MRLDTDFLPEVIPDPSEADKQVVRERVLTQVADPTDQQTILAALGLVDA